MAGECANLDPGLAFVIDDDKLVCSVLTLALTKAGLAVETFPTAPTALAALDTRHPIIIFLDMVLQQSDAVDVLKGLGARRYPGVVHLVSGGRFELIEAMQRIGVAEGVKLAEPINKPFRRDDIIKAATAAQAMVAH